MLIRPLDPVEDLAAVTTFYAEAPDYWLLAEGRTPGIEKAREFFTDCPPGCDPLETQRLGLFLGPRLSGLGELSFGFPDPEDAYLGLMILGPWAQGAGNGRVFLAQVADRARLRKAGRLLLGVIEANPRGRAFWEREGFRATGVKRIDAETGQVIHRLMRLL